MKLTCVTAVFNAIKSGNREKLIRCVESVAAIKSEHEHLIYDGASTDGTIEILAGLASKFPNVTVVSEADTGLYNALNKGVHDAKGEWLYVLGCDDYIADSCALDELLDDMPKADLVASPTYVDRGGGPTSGFWKRRQLLTGMPYSHQGVLMRTMVIQEFGGFDESFRLAGDYDLVMKFHNTAKRISYKGRPYGAFSIGGLSSDGKKEKAEVARTIIRTFGLTGNDAEQYISRLQLPWWLMLRLLFHKDATLRISSLSMMARKILKWRRKGF